jgi:hypothetical protein
MTESQRIIDHLQVHGECSPKDFPGIQLENRIGELRTAGHDIKTIFEPDGSATYIWRGYRAIDVGYHDRRVAKRLEDPEFRAGYEEQSEQSSAPDETTATVNALRYYREQVEAAKKAVKNDQAPESLFADAPKQRRWTEE